MRLIDADKLLKFFTVDTANQTYRFGTVKKQIESATTVQAIPLDKVKQAREEIEKLYEDLDGYDPQALGDYASHVDEILDKLIAESEE